MESYWAAANEYDLDFLVRSLETYPAPVTWYILKQLMDWYLRPGVLKSRAPSYVSEDVKKILSELNMKNYERSRAKFASVLIETFFKAFVRTEPGGPNHIDDRMLMIEFFGSVADSAKKGHEAKIRKWLKDFCQTVPLRELFGNDRDMLARALVLNGCFEECMAHKIFEALPYLKVLALGKYREAYGLKDLKGSISKSPAQALRENHNAHAWITMLRLMAMRGDIYFAWILDPTDNTPLKRDEKGTDVAHLRYALIFKPPATEEVSGL